MIRLALMALAAMALGACALQQGEQAALYDQLQEQDVRMAAATLQRSLEQGRSGETLSWRNVATGAKGSLTPQRTMLTAEGYYCRDYDETIVVAGRSGQWRHTACRNKDGRWVWI